MRPETLFHEQEARYPLCNPVRGITAFIPRALRLPIETIVYFRVNGDQDCHAGRTLNISRTGVLFRAESDFDPSAELVLSIILPTSLSGTSPTSILCRAVAVRKELEGLPHGQSVVAAEFTHYRFVSCDD